MNRRNLIKHVALLMGGTLSAPTLFAMENLDKKLGFDSTFSLNKTQKAILAEVAEMIIPRTKTAGAKDAGVPAFIEMMINDCYKAAEKRNFTNGLDELGKLGFLKQNQAQKTATLKKLEADTKELMKKKNVKQTKMGDNEDKELMDTDGKGIPFWRLVKEMTLLGYFTSEKGITENFDYHQIPGRLEVIKIKPGQKSFAY